MISLCDSYFTGWSMASNTRELSLSPIQQLLLEKRELIDEWFTANTPKEELPIYCSVDIRHSGYKITAIDTNLFPAGFNNLHHNNWPLCVSTLKSALEDETEGQRSILIIPEDHTRNTAYLKNIYLLKQLIDTAGFNTYIGSISPDQSTKINIQISEENQFSIEPLQVASVASSLSSCFILLNNDLSEKPSNLLINFAKGKKITPPICAGWFNRSKYNHLVNYNLVANSFCRDIGVDPWHLTSEIDSCPPGNVAQNDEVREAMATKASKILSKTNIEYQKRNIVDQAFIIIKTDPGTYGMGVVSVNDDQEIINLNRGKRKKLMSIKGNSAPKNFIIQEGISTIEKFENNTAEHTFYAIRDKIVGGFIRAHSKKNVRENLNSVGSAFIPLEYDNNKPHLYTLSIPARLAIIATVEEKIPKEYIEAEII
ncbi:glutamate--cysteine ligase [Candidatus Ichthyocystis sparus]|uniref:glutamate--cysteine ligase n=1 Tax=Candidatus Ichthyocystis sparus TaxID=1561004 RepID=UPI000B85DA66|nr:glutamate--cysteine ligase [Candidatus Ichthyocystis sparus]